MISDAENVLRVLEWDSDFFGVKVAEITSSAIERYRNTSFSSVVKAEGIEFVQYKCPVHDREGIEFAEANGFSLKDVRLQYSRKLDVTLGLIGGESEGFRSRRARTDDSYSLQRIAESEFRSSRYWTDARFCPKDVKKFYADWVAKAIEGTFDDYALIYEYHGVPVGFVTVRIVSDIEVILGLVVIDERTRNRGYGKQMLRSATSELTAKGYGRVQVVTQGRNTVARKLYESTGFCLQEVSLYYHRWTQ